MLLPHGAAVRRVLVARLGGFGGAEQRSGGAGVLDKPSFVFEGETKVVQKLSPQYKVLLHDECAPVPARLHRTARAPCCLI